MIPDTELSLLLDAAEDAVEAAEAGRFSEGHARLVAGLERAREHVSGRQPWAAELVARYRFALHRYSDTYSVLRHWQPPLEAADR